MIRLLATLALVALSTPAILAQAPGTFGRPPGPGSPGYRPPVSPYLNLARGGVAGINYYGLVRPQIESNQAFQEIERQLRPVDPAMGPGGVLSPQGTTGTAGIGIAPTFGLGTTTPGFQTQSRYYQNLRPVQGTQNLGGVAPGAGTLLPQRGR